MYRKRRRKLVDVREFMREMGRRGGKARAKKLTSEERLAIAIKASNAAKEARKRKAEAKKKANPNSRYICEILRERKDGGGK